MARIRSLKPEFFTDEDLAELSYAARIAFAGLWVMADGHGRMEDRPKYLKTQILPYDNEDMDALLNQLSERGFIVRYTVNGSRFIWIPNFRKHQRITGREADAESEFPPYEGEKIEGPEATGNQSGNNGETTGKQPMFHQCPGGGRERKGIGGERKGKGGEGASAPQTTPPDEPLPSRSAPIDCSVEVLEVELRNRGWHETRVGETARQFWEHYEASGWRDKGGRPIVNWRYVLQSWQRQEPDYQKPLETGNGRSGKGHGLRDARPIAEVASERLKLLEAAQAPALEAGR